VTAVAADDGVDGGEAEGGQGSNAEVCFVFCRALHYVLSTSRQSKKKSDNFPADQLSLADFQELHCQLLPHS
jgi:hypothetical protein